MTQISVSRYKTITGYPDQGQRLDLSWKGEVGRSRFKIIATFPAVRVALLAMHRNSRPFNVYSLLAFLVLGFLCVDEVDGRRCRGLMCTRDSSKQTKTEAPSVIPSASLPPGRLLECCACGRAVYNITFIGKWKKSTHPRHFPGPMARWSGMIGCTHNKHYIMWRYGGYASPGVKKLSEWGSTKLLEEEMKNQERDVLNVAKTRGLYKGVGGASTELKANRTHNLLSIIAKMIPSPDWSVGVDRLNLCNANCSWKKMVLQDLYPWDAGTDDGITFTSVNTESNPQKPIRRLTSKLHNHTSASFHRKRGGNMQPVAQLQIELQRVSGACDHRRSPPFPPAPRRVDCEVSRWSKWTECSVTCGKGKQSRGRAIVRKPSKDGIKCPTLRERRRCSRVCNEPNIDPSADCKVSPWSPWSSCRGLCGRGSKSRTRVVLQKPQPNGRQCPAVLRWRKCKLPKCKAVIFGNCVVSEWTPWTQCTKTCNRGKMFRYRKVVNEKDEDECKENLKERKRCNTHKCPV